MENMRLKRRTLTSDVFVTGTKALTLDGKIVRNLEDAFKRIREVAAPANVRRHEHFNPQWTTTGTGRSWPSCWLGRSWGYEATHQGQVLNRFPSRR